MSIHVTPHSRGWQVKRGTAEKAYKVTDTQREAAVVARKVAINQKTDVKIHNKKGQVREGNSYKKPTSQTKK